MNNKDLERILLELLQPLERNVSNIVLDKEDYYNNLWLREILRGAGARFVGADPYAATLHVPKQRQDELVHRLVCVLRQLRVNDNEDLN